MKNFVIALLLTALPALYFAQLKTPEGEELLYSFQTLYGKTLMVSRLKTEKVVICRYGTAEHTDLEIRSHKESDSRILYAYHPGGGAPDQLMDANYLYFVKDNIQYIVFDKHFQKNNSYSTGLETIDLATQKTTIIPVRRKTIQGNLTQFRDNDLLEIGDEIFD